MSKRYHINPENGMAGVCNPKVTGICAYGENTPHYDAEGAIQAQEQAQEGMFGLFNTETKDGGAKPAESRTGTEEASPLCKPLSEVDTKIFPLPERKNLDTGQGHWEGNKLEAFTEESKGTNDFRGEKVSAIRNDLKKAQKAGYLPANLKFTVRKEGNWSYSSITVTISGAESPHNWTIDGRGFRDLPTKKATPEYQEVLDRTNAIMDSYNYYQSNPQIDDFNSGFYGKAEISDIKDVTYKAMERERAKFSKFVRGNRTHGVPVTQIPGYEEARNSYLDSAEAYKLAAVKDGAEYRVLSKGIKPHMINGTILTPNDAQKREINDIAKEEMQNYRSHLSPVLDAALQKGKSISMIF